jgi:hypothetical protein
VALCEELCRADEQALFDKEVTQFFLGDANEVGHDVGNQVELLDAVVSLATDVDHPEGVGVLPAVETVDYEDQPPNRLPVVVTQDEV